MALIQQDCSISLDLGPQSPSHAEKYSCPFMVPSIKLIFGMLSCSPPKFDDRENKSAGTLLFIKAIV